MKVVKKKLLSHKERSEIAKQVWANGFAKGTRLRAQPRILLSDEERSEAAKRAWETRRKNQRRLERLAKKAERVAKQAAAERKARREQRVKVVSPETVSPVVDVSHVELVTENVGAQV